MTDTLHEQGPVTIPYLAKDMMQRAGLMSKKGRRKRLSVRVGFADGMDSTNVVIENDGKTLEINPATREAYVSDGIRKAYLGVMDRWTPDVIKRLIERYLGIMADATVNQAIRELGISEMTSTMSINTPPVGFDMRNNNAGVIRRRRRSFKF